MRTSTRLLHETLLRLSKGMLKAWERWLRQQPDETLGGPHPSAETDSLSHGG